LDLFHRKNLVGVAIKRRENFARPAAANNVEFEVLIDALAGTGGFEIVDDETGKRKAKPPRHAKR
jgi:hypothetical protein